VGGAVKRFQGKKLWLKCGDFLSNEVLFILKALTEYAEAVQYYAERRSEVAEAFIDVVEDAVGIRESPTHWGVMDVLILTELVVVWQWIFIH